MKRLIVLSLVVVSLVVVHHVAANNASSGDGWVITLSPKTLYLDSHVEALTVHSNIPIGLVLCDYLELEGVAPIRIKVDSLGCLVAKFPIEAFDDLESGNTTLTLTGLLWDSGVVVPFAVSDTIRVK